MAKIFTQSTYLPWEIDPQTGIPYADMVSSVDEFPTKASRSPAALSDELRAEVAKIGVPFGPTPAPSPTPMPVPGVAPAAPPVAAKPRVITSNTAAKKNEQTTGNKTVTGSTTPAVNPNALDSLDKLMPQILKNVPGLQSMVDQGKILRQIAEAQMMAADQAPSVNLMPAMALTDAWTGSNFASSYTPPKMDEGRIASLYKMAQDNDAKLASAVTGLIKPSFGQTKESYEDFKKMLAGNTTTINIKNDSDPNGGRRGGKPTNPFYEMEKDFVSSQRGPGRAQAILGLRTIDEINNLLRTPAGEVNGNTQPMTVNRVKFILAKASNGGGNLSNIDVASFIGDTTALNRIKSAVKALTENRATDEDAKAYLELAGKMKQGLTNYMRQEIANTAKAASQSYRQFNNPEMNLIIDEPSAAKHLHTKFGIPDQEEVAPKSLMDILMERRANR